MSRKFSAITAWTAWISTEAASRSGSFSTLPNTVTTPTCPESTTTKLDTAMTSSPAATPSTCTPRPAVIHGTGRAPAARTCAAIAIRARPTAIPPTISSIANISLPMALSPTVVDCPRA